MHVNRLSIIIDKITVCEFGRKFWWSVLKKYACYRRWILLKSTICYYCLCFIHHDNGTSILCHRIARKCHVIYENSCLDSIYSYNSCHRCSITFHDTVGKVAFSLIFAIKSHSAIRRIILDGHVLYYWITFATGEKTALIVRESTTTNVNIDYARWTAGEYAIAGIIVSKGRRNELYICFISSARIIACFIWIMVSP